MEILITEHGRISVYILYAILSFLTLLAFGMKLKKKKVDNFLIRLKTLSIILFFPLSIQCECMNLIFHQ